MFLSLNGMLLLYHVHVPDTFFVFYLIGIHFIQGWRKEGRVSTRDQDLERLKKQMQYTYKNFFKKMLQCQLICKRFKRCQEHISMF